MKTRHWVPTRDGELSEDGLQRTLEDLGYEVEQVAYPGDVWVPAHIYRTDIALALVSGTFIASAPGTPEQRLEPGDAIEIAAGEELQFEVPDGAAILRGVRSDETERKALHPLRFGVLALLIALINGWCVLHLGLELASLAVPSSLIAVLPVVIELAGRGADDRSGRFASRWLARLASTPVLLLLAVSFFLLATFSASFVVRASDLDRPVAVTVTPDRAAPLEPEGAGRLERDDTLRFWRPTHPWGRTFEIDAEGYLAEEVELRSWWPTEIELGRDLKRAVTLVVRLGYDLAVGSGTLTVQVTPPEGWARGAIYRQKLVPEFGQWAYSIGSDSSPVPQSFRKEWKAQAEEETTDETSRADLFGGWVRPKRVEPCPVVAVPGATVTLTFQEESDRCTARDRFELSEEPFQSHRLLGDPGLEEEDCTP